MSPINQGKKKGIYQNCKLIVILYNSTEGIFVRAYEERMDLFRAAIIGAPGTPYHDGIFFFDIFLPPQYPNEPPVSDL